MKKLKFMCGRQSNPIIYYTPYVSLHMLTRYVHIIMLRKKKKKNNFYKAVLVGVIVDTFRCFSCAIDRKK